MHGPIDDRTFALLRDEIGDDEGCAVFARTYLELLPSRMAEIRRALNNGETEMCEVVANLAATSRMLGAVSLAEHLERLHEGGCVSASNHARDAYVRRLQDLVRALEPALRERITALETGRTGP